MGFPVRQRSVAPKSAITHSTRLATKNLCKRARFRLIVSTSHPLAIRGGYAESTNVLDRSAKLLDDLLFKQNLDVLVRCYPPSWLRTKHIFENLPRGLITPHCFNHLWSVLGLEFFLPREVQRPARENNLGERAAQTVSRSSSRNRVKCTFTCAAGSRCDWRLLTLRWICIIGSQDWDPRA